jgi:hypothetical protein
MLSSPFWRTPLATRWLPAGASLLLHATFLLALIFAYRHPRPVPLPPARVPDAVLIEGAKVGGVLNPGLGDDPARPAVQSTIVPLPPDLDGTAQRPTHAPSQSPVASLGQFPDAPRTGTGIPKVGVGVGPGTATPAQPGGGSPDPARYGLSPSSGAKGPRAQFMGISGDAVRIVYVCDASASMMGKLPRLKAQLKSSIDQLKPVQWFNVIFFKQGGALPIAGNALVQAVPANKSRLSATLDKVEVGSNSDPLPALDAAFAQTPQVVYLLTDGGFELGSVSNRQVLDHIAALNPDNAVHINTIIFISEPGDLDTEDVKSGIDVLQKIARQTGGTFKVVVADEPHRP